MTTDVTKIPSMQGIIAQMGKVVGELEILASNDGIVAGNVSNTQTEVAEKQQDTVEEYAKNATSLEVFNDIASGVSSLESIGMGAAVVKAPSLAEGIASGLRDIAAPLAGAAAQAGSSVMSVKQGDVSAQQECESGTADIIGGLANGSMATSGQLVQTASTMESNIYSSIANESQANIYYG